MRRVLRRGLQGRDQHLLHLLGGDRRRPARTRIIDQPVQPQLAKPRAPLPDRRGSHPHGLSDLAIGHARSALQHDPRAQRQRLGRLPSSLPPRQLLPLGICQLQNGFGTTSSWHSQAYHIYPTNLRRRTLVHYCVIFATSGVVWSATGPRPSKFALSVPAVLPSTRLGVLRTVWVKSNAPLRKLPDPWTRADERSVA